MTDSVFLQWGCDRGALGRHRVAAAQGRVHSGCAGLQSGASATEAVIGDVSFGSFTGIAPTVSWWGYVLHQRTRDAPMGGARLVVHRPAGCGGRHKGRLDVAYLVEMGSAISSTA